MRGGKQGKEGNGAWNTVLISLQSGKTKREGIGTRLSLTKTAQTEVMGEGRDASQPKSRTEKLPAWWIFGNCGRPGTAACPGSEG